MHIFPDKQKLEQRSLRDLADELAQRVRQLQFALTDEPLDPHQVANAIESAYAPAHDLLALRRGWGDE